VGTSAAPELSQCRFLVRIGDDDEVSGLGVVRRGRLLGQANALLNQLRLYVPLEVEPLAWSRADRRRSGSAGAPPVAHGGSTILLRWSPAWHFIFRAT
jgi:hypothetical protein